MTRSRKRKLLQVRAKKVWMPIASAFLAGAPMVHAQEADTSELAEVLVTAQKRTEDVQKVPISMQVLSTEKLEQLQVSNFDDYAKFLPSVTFQTLGPGQAQLYFRGVASGINGGSVQHSGSTPATGVYLDETPITTIANNPDLHVYDVQRVEALAGPQGTLYGASSLSGTLRIITNKPDPSAFSAGYDVKADKYSAGNGGGGFEGFLNLPISDTAAIRLVGYYEHNGGYISNVPASRTYQRPPISCGAYDQNGNCIQPIDTGLPNAPITVTNSAYVKSNFNPDDTFGGRAALKIDLNDRWTITPAVIYQNEKTSGTFVFDPKIGNLKVTDFTPDYTQDHWYQAALTVEGKISNYDFVYSGGYFERHSQIATDYSEYSVAYDSNGYSRFRDNFGNLLDPTQTQLQIDRYTKMTHEVRISSPATDRVHFVAGLFYQRQTDTTRDEYLLPGIGDNAQYDFAIPGQSPNLYLTQQDRVDRDYAAFTDITWSINDRWKLSGGIRGFVARNTLYGFFGFNNTFVDVNNGNNGDNFFHGSGTSSCSTPVVTTGNLPCINTNAGVRDAGQTHRVNLTYQVDASHMLYATYSTGFRPGGVNRREGIAPYQSDTLSNYEIGWKTGWLDHTLRFNGAIFYEQWQGVQLGVNGPNGITDYWNIGNANVKGLESDINWLLWDHLDLSVGGTYVNAKTTTDFCGEDLLQADQNSPRYGQLFPSCPGATGTSTGPAAPAGTRLPVTPEIKGNAIARYKFNYAGYKIFTQAALLHQSSSNPDLPVRQESAVGPLPAFTSVDLSMGVARDKWTLELYLDNAFDKRGELNRQSQCAAANLYCYTNYRVYPIKPQMLGIKFGNKF